MGTELNNITEFEALAETPQDAPTAIPAEPTPATAVLGAG
jgi:glyoxylate carboligase